ncbi:hypothetical protein FOA52_008101 [Chlamydomonas sp. UWO 241]|nr:hypothetical protein FOA52_008101 [Chlamydomonas sp. UWO 241]
MSPIDVHGFCLQVPKAELHLHIEGTLEPEMMLALAKRNGLKAPYASVEAARAAYDFADLQSFLDLYYAGCAVLVKREDFFDLAWAYLKKCAEENVTHTEMMFDPQTHMANGVAFETVLNGLIDAQSAAQNQLGVTSSLVMCFLRHLSEADALKTLELALPHKHHLAAVGLDSAELGHPPAKFVNVMAKARAAGLKTVAHAGEEGPAQFVWDAMEMLQGVAQ